ncbi:hypothetical protein [Lacihabitans sp. CCS-44]|uniref:hypothetical protein n=1 Tax=Lacihabitans sp. CCS-44 TaxID=2487331 RepID=UPI0020CB81C9|nr:hypothetical protein [Lacihabitans sp. CCS-44]
MVIEINKNSDPKEIKKLLHSSPKKGNLKDFFGKLKRNIDGLEFQKKARNEWD